MRTLCESILQRGDSMVGIVIVAGDDFFDDMPWVPTGPDVATIRTRASDPEDPDRARLPKGHPRIPYRF
jgi:hypothetical protein